MGPIPPSSVPGTKQCIRLSRLPGTCGSRLSLCVRLVALVLMSILTPPALSQPPDAAQFVFAFNHDVSAQLGSTKINPAERKRRFAVLVDEGLDLDVIGKRLLGWRWTNAAPADRQAFRGEFRNYLIQNFAMKVTGVEDGRMTVTSIVQNGGTGLVLTEVTTNEAVHEPFAWHVVHTPAGWRLCDVVVNNVSMAALMQSQFDSVLQDGQPGFGPLLRLLHEKSQE
jgi:phospholipid transport system substrate-binding protein